MFKPLTALAFGFLAAGLVGCASSRCACCDSAETNTAEQLAALAPVHQFVDSFNAGDSAKALAACADPISIVDDFPPHEWHGTGAASAWLRDYEADAKKNGITPGSVTLGKPRHVDVNGDRAYVVVPADYAYKKNGTPVIENNCTMTLALQKGASGWLITAWAWSKR